MRIAFITPFPPRDEHYPLSMSGVAAYARNLIGALHGDRSHPLDVTVLCPRLAGVHPREFSLGTEGHARVEPCFRLGLFALPRLLGTVRKGRYDIVHVQHEMGIYGTVAANIFFPLFLALVRRRSAVIVTLHSIVDRKQVTAEFSARYSSLFPSFLLARLLQAFYRLAGICSHALIVHTEDFAQALRDYGVPARMIRVIPHGAADPTEGVREQYGELLRAFRVPSGMHTIFGYFGFLTMYKDLAFLMHEFAAYARRDPHAVLLVAGGMHPRLRTQASYRAYVQRLQEMSQCLAPGQILWIGGLASEDVGRFFKLIDCLVLPYTACYGASGPLSLAVGSGVPALVSSALASSVTCSKSVFTFADGSLATKLEEFAHQNIAAHAHRLRFVERSKNVQLFAHAAHSTLSLYRRVQQENPVKRTLVIGAYGQGNLGDEVLLQECLALLDRSACRVTSAQPGLTAQDFRVAVVDSQKGLFARLRAFLQARTVIVGGGDQFKLLPLSTGRRRYTTLFQHWLIAVLSRVLGKTLVYLGIGIGDVSTRTADALTRWSLRLAALVTVRDPASERFCRERCPGVRVLPASDLAFLSPAHEERARRIRATTGGCVLGVAPCFNVHDPSAHAAVVAELGRAIDAFLASHEGNRVVLLPFQTSFHPHHDIITCYEVLEHVTRHDRCRVEKGLTRETVGAVFASLDFLWGMRLHAAVFACRYAVPFLGLLYDAKVRHFLQSIDCEEWAVPLDASFTAARLLSLQERLTARREETVAHLEREARELGRRCEVNGEILRTLTRGDALTVSTPPAGAASFRFVS